jgi:hypothetical protein
MGKTEFAEQVDEIQAALIPFLMGNGFKKRGRTFNRTSKDGLISVINFQMGAFDPPGTTYIPGIRENFYGLFTINLGIFVPEVYRAQREGGVKNFVQEYHCCIRARLGRLGPKRQDIWWKAVCSQELVSDLQKRLEMDALPFLQHFETREAIIRDWPDYFDKNIIGLSNPNIVLAIILANQGRTDEARFFLEKQVKETQHTGHKEYVRNLAKRLGLEELNA